MFRLLRTASLAVLVACGSAQAAPVTSLAGATLYAFPNVDLFSAGPQVVAPGITWSSDSASSVYGYDNGYGFQTNGNWSTGLSMIGTNNGTGTMRIDFATAVAGVGAFLNWSRFSNGQPDGIQPLIAVYDSSNNLLESFALTFGPLGGTNNGEFHGFLRNTADISSIRFTGGYIGAANLQALTTTVPEPASLALMTLGVAAAAFAARRRRA